MTKATKYPKGYFPKIKYWSDVIAKELSYDDPCLAVVDNAHAKMEYFLGKQFDLGLRIADRG